MGYHGLDVSSLFHAPRGAGGGPPTHAVEVEIVLPRLGTAALEDAGDSLRLWISDGTSIHLDRRHRADEPSCDRRPRSSADGAEPPIWGFDGSSTNQAPGNSDCVLRPSSPPAPTPIRGGDDTPGHVRGAPADMTPHPSNTRAALRRDRREVRRPGAVVRHRAGVHLLQGRPTRYGFPMAASRPPGPYYCGVGSDEIWGREVVEAHRLPASKPASPSRAPTPRS
jgi:hypothetical protein